MVTVPDGAIAMTACSAKAAADLLMLRGRFPDITQCFAVVVSGRADGIYARHKHSFQTLNSCEQDNFILSWSDN